jgi:hypothetical protein
MRITKTDLKQMIVEVLNEANIDVSSGQELRTTGLEQSKEMGTLTPRERQVAGAFQQIINHLKQPQDQATPQFMMLVKKLMQQLEATQPDQEPAQPPKEKINNGHSI